MKNFLISFQDFRHIKADYSLMLVTLFFMKMGQFMLIPFLSIYLARYTSASPAIIGLIVGIGPFAYGLAGIVAGIAVDRFGVKKSIIGSLFFGSLTLFFFFYGKTIAWYFLMNVLVGITRTFSDIGSKSYGISGLSTDQRKITFSLRFMVVNTAAAIGPVLGAYFAAANSLIAFQIIGIFYFVLAILTIFLLKDTNKDIRTASTNTPATLRESFTIIRNDKALQMLLIIYFIIWIVFSQLDSTLAQYLHASLPNGIKVYSSLLIINAIICVTLQLIVAKLSKNIDEFIICFFSMLFFAISYFIMALFINLSALIISVVLLTLAEIIAMPFNDSLIARIAPPNRIGTYYGALGFAMLGLGIGPMVGGIIYEYFNAKVVFLGCSLLSLSTLFLYRKLLSDIPQETTKEYALEQN